MVLCLLRCQNRAEIRVCRDNNAVLREGFCKDHLVLGRVHPIRPDVHGVVSGRREQLSQKGRQRVIDEESQAEYGRGSSRSIADAAANLRHSRMSSVWRSGYSARISRSDRPPASNRSTVATGMRRCRTQGTPPICAGSTVIRSKFFIAILQVLSQVIGRSSKEKLRRSATMAW